MSRKDRPKILDLEKPQRAMPTTRSLTIQEARRAQVEMLFLSGIENPRELAELVGATVPTIRGDIEALQVRWATRYDPTTMQLRLNATIEKVMQEALGLYVEKHDPLDGNLAVRAAAAQAKMNGLGERMTINVFTGPLAQVILEAQAEARQEQEPIEGDYLELGTPLELGDGHDDTP